MEVTDPNSETISLALDRQYKRRGTRYADFSYQGATTVEIFVNGTSSGTTSSNPFTLRFPKGSGSYVVQVCQATADCSNTVTVNW